MRWFPDAAVWRGFSRRGTCSAEVADETMTMFKEKPKRRKMTVTMASTPVVGMTSNGTRPVAGGRRGREGAPR